MNIPTIEELRAAKWQLHTLRELFLEIAKPEIPENDRWQYDMDAKRDERREAWTRARSIVLYMPTYGIPYLHACKERFTNFVNAMVTCPAVAYSIPESLLAAQAMVTGMLRMAELQQGAATWVRDYLEGSEA